MRAISNDKANNLSSVLRSEKSNSKVAKQVSVSHATAQNYHSSLKMNYSSADNNSVYDNSEKYNSAEDGDSFLSNESDLTYKTESSTHYAENLKLKRYVLTFHELSRYEEKHKAYYYDDSTLDERLHISAINFNTTLPQKYRLTPVILKDNEYSQIRQWRRCIVNDEHYFPPHATTLDQLYLNNLLCHVVDTVFKDDKDRSEIEFIVENTSPIFKYLFPSKGSISYKWEKSCFIPNNNTNKKLRIDFVLYYDGKRIGCGEVKKDHNISFKLLESDRARIAETMKR
ncbi:hypothetical protein G6F37_011699 [Rhizopus arrhizus]|nr:hypothetical protein G6F38_012250 [Rhizopus arrhizus]KAG1147911.1 hypothetical protein G6F37_011699 [Rhizopus arrhizus]